MASPSPRRLVRGLLRRLGLELRSSSADLRAGIARAEERATNARRQRDQYREEMLHWKAKCRTMIARQQAKHRRLVHKAEAAMQKNEAAVQKKLAHLARQEESYITQLKALSERVELAERAVWNGREALSALELKLDLVDGAINTLDRRYRTIVVHTAKSGD